MGTSKNVTWQEYNGTDYDILLPQPSVATSEKIGGIIADTAEINPQFESQFECKISRRTKKLLMPTSISPYIIGAPVPISHGGTDANNKEQALINLGVKDYVIGLDVLDNREVVTYKSGRKVLTERRFNSNSISIQTPTDDRKWYKSLINAFTPSDSSIGNMNTWKYWNLQVVAVGSEDVLPMFVNIQTGYNPTSNSIPWRLFSTSSLIFNANQLLFLLTVIV
nr:MAG TPA: hypothetical protein [Caudoviricetes sp.]